MEFMHVVETNLLIGYDESLDSYFVYEIPGVPLFTGTYNKCLQVIGGICLGISLEDSIKDATEI